MVWHAKPNCPEDRVLALERAVNSMPVEWLAEPATGEIFSTMIDCERRLRGFSLVEGFDIVRNIRGNKTTASYRFECIFHGTTSCNNWGLEPHVENDSEGKILSIRKREGTMVRQAGCLWQAALSFKIVGKRNSGYKSWVLTVKTLEHTGHDLVDDPLMFSKHLNSLDEYQALVRTAKLHRQAVIPYSESRRVLEADAFGTNLTSRQYYNTVRHMKPNKNTPETIGGLLIALDEAGFVYRTRVDEELGADGHMVARKLQQIWFSHPSLLKASARFVADFLLVIDGKFNTNKLPLPLLVAVGVSNSGSTFPCAFSYCPSESDASFTFFWDSLKAHCFGGDKETDAVPPRVILGDQAAGLLSSVPKAFPDAILQSCSWHAVEAMVAHYRKTGYKKDYIMGYFDEDKVWNAGLKGFSWDYVKSTTVDELERNRAFLISKLKPRDQAYIRDIWIQKEDRVIYLYTQFYANLGATASQRGQSYHKVLREIANGQLTLEDSARNLYSKIKSIIEDLETNENKSLLAYPRLAQSYAFRSLRLKMSNFAITMVELEWRALNQSNGVNLGECKCEALLRFGIACKHKLLRAYRNGEPIPRSFLHPRWWIQGPAIHNTNWVPAYPDDEEDSENRGIQEPVNNVLSLTRQQLNSEEKHRFDSIIVQAEQNLIQIGQQRVEEQAMPIGQPDPTPKRHLTQKKTHEKADAQGLSSPELRLRELDKAESAARQAEKEVEKEAEIDVRVQAQELPMTGVAIVPATPPPTRTPSHKRTFTLVDRTPEKPREAPLQRVLPSLPPPASTAPAQLATTIAQSRRGRKRKVRNYSKVHHDGIDSP